MSKDEIENAAKIAGVPDGPNHTKHFQIMSQEEINKEKAEQLQKQIEEARKDGIPYSEKDKNLVYDTAKEPLKKDKKS